MQQKDEEPVTVAVIGGGISGLSAAWLLEQQGKQLLEGGIQKGLESLFGGRKKKDRD